MTSSLTSMIETEEEEDEYAENFGAKSLNYGHNFGGKNLNYGPGSLQHQPKNKNIRSYFGR